MRSAPRSRVRHWGGPLTVLCIVAAVAGAVGLGGALGNAKRTVSLLQTPPSASADPIGGDEAQAAGATESLPSTNATSPSDTGSGPGALAGAPAESSERSSAGQAAGTVAERGAAALALIHYPWQETGFSIKFAGPKNGLLGLAEPSINQITIYVRSGQSTADIARVLAHEIGHAVDFSLTTDTERTDYREIRGLDNRSWYPDCDACSDYASPAGDWAETFAYWLLGNGRFLSELAGKPSAAQLTALGSVFAADGPRPSTVSTVTAPTVTTTTTPATTPTVPTTAPVTTTTHPSETSTPGNTTGARPGGGPASRWTPTAGTNGGLRGRGRP